MAIIKDTEDFTIGLTDNHTDWYSLLQFCVCKVNPRYYKNIYIAKDKYGVWWLNWDSLNDNHSWAYNFPKNVSNKTIKKLEKELPTYIKVRW